MIDPAWIVMLMADLEPSPPWRSTYETTAAVIAAEADAHPLRGLGPERTAALLVSIAWFEGRLKPDAEGDCRDKAGRAVDSVSGVCPPGSRPRSVCLMQIHETNHRGLGVTAAALQSDVGLCVRTGNRILHQSFVVCAGRPMEDRLSWYASGGPRCSEAEDPRRKSRHRVERAIRVHRQRPPTRPGPIPAMEPLLGGPPPLAPSLPGRDDPGASSRDLP